MKKVLFSIAIFTLLVSLTGCNDSNDKLNKDKNESKGNSNIESKDYSKMTCTNSNDSVASTIITNIEYEDNYIKNIKYTYNIKSDGQTLATMLKDEFEKDFKSVTGVDSNYSNNVWTQTFNFEKVNLNDYQNAMTNYLNFVSSSTEKDFSYIKDDKILLDSYKSIELSNYNCE